MDPFEARLQFQQMLKTITSSTNNNILITNFLLANQELQEDFHSCILESLNVNDLNYKINIFQLIEIIMQRSLPSSDKPYIKNLIRDFDLIITKVLSYNEEKFCPINLSSTYTILAKISQLLGFEKVKEYQLQYRFESNSISDSITVSLQSIENRQDKDEVLTKIWDLIIAIRRKSKQDRIKREQQQPVSANTTVNISITDTPAVTTKHVLRRMEDDRERTKKLKETLWELSTLDLKSEYLDVVSKYSLEQTANFKDMIELNGIVGQCYNDWSSSLSSVRKR